MAKVKRILLVEDSPHDIELILAALEENDLASEVMVVRDGAEALDYLYLRGPSELQAESHPAVVLLDMKLPKIDGLEVLRQIKTDPALRSIPVVMLTSSREDRDLLKSYSLGVNAYVVKPVAFPEFVEAIKQVGVFWGMINEPPPKGLS
jgi:CheY-like chemotaxis protein